MEALRPVQVYEWFLKLPLLCTECWIKDWQDLPLHQMRIWTSQGKCSKQMKRNGGALLSLFLFFLSLCWIRVIPQADPLLEAELSGVNHLLNTLHYFLTARICHQRHFEALLALMRQPGPIVMRLTTINYSLLMISYYPDMVPNMFPIFNTDNWLVTGKLRGQFTRCHACQCLFEVVQQISQLFLLCVKSLNLLCRHILILLF